MNNFYPRPPRGGRPQTARPRCPCERNFYPRPPRGGRRLCRGRGASSCGISIHALREEGDIFCFAGAYSVNSISIHALREEGDKIWGMGNVIIAISIHALREEGDAPKETKASCQFYFYPRPPRGGRLSIMGSGQGAKKFLSTPSARRATSQRLLPLCPALYFYPRPPRGGRRPTRTTTSAAIGFLSTPSARRATLLSGYGRVRDDISIHALREEGDRRTAHTEHRLDDFYPRPPRGGRLRERFIGGRQLQHFYPRPPRGGRHHQPVASSIPNPISIHALREEGDPL